MAVTASQLREYLRLPPDTVTVTGDATIDRTAFIAAVTEGGTYVFTKGDSGWTLNGTAATLSEYGIIADVAETEITVEYTTIPVDAYINAAKSKARVAGIPAFASNAQYDLFIMALAAMYYDNRGMVFADSSTTYNQESINRMINSFVLELRYGDEDG